VKIGPLDARIRVCAILLEATVSTIQVARAESKWDRRLRYGHLMVFGKDFTL